MGGRPAADSDSPLPRGEEEKSRKPSAARPDCSRTRRRPGTGGDSLIARSEHPAGNTSRRGVRDREKRVYGKQVALGQGTRDRGTPRDRSGQAPGQSRKVAEWHKIETSAVEHR